MKARDIFSTAYRALKYALETNRMLFVVLLFLNSVQGSIVYLQFASFASIVDEIILITKSGKTIDDLLKSSLLLGTSFLLPALTGNLTIYFRTIFNLQHSLRFDLDRVKKQGSMDVQTIESNHYQNLLRTAEEWGTGSLQNLHDFILTSALSVASIVTSISILWLLNEWLVAFAFLAASPIYFYYKRYSLKVFRARWFSLEDRRVIRDRLQHFTEIRKIVEVIMLGLTDWFRAEIKRKVEVYNNRILAAEKKKAISYSLLSVWYLIFLCAAIALMTRDAVQGSIMVGSLLLAFSTYTSFYQTINSYLETISLTEDAARYASKWFELFDLKSDPEKDPAPAIKFKTPPIIDFRNVSFRYPNVSADASWAIENLSLRLEPGEQIAIVGPNGSGKTTLSKLLCGIYDPTFGSVQVNGQDLSTIDKASWYQSIAVLFQDFPQYHVSVRDAVRIGRISEPLDYPRLMQAVEYSGSDKFINQLPKMFDQLIWREFKDGVDLSRGQHQSLAIARVLYRDSPIMIFDEPTSAIDPESENTLFHTFEQKLKGKTVIFITHRLTSIKTVDRILVLENGQIVEQGSHDQLISLDRIYGRLFKAHLRQL